MYMQESTDAACNAYAKKNLWIIYINISGSQFAKDRPENDE